MEQEDENPAGESSLSTFPRTSEEFEADARVSFSKVDQKWILEADDGAEFEFDEALKRWLPVMDETLLAQQQAAYAVAGVDENEPAQPQRKRKNVYVNGEEENGRLPAKKTKANAAAAPRKNTAVYVTNLPTDVTVDEVKSVFSKCGVIAEEIDQGKPRIKLYTDDDGNIKGDALIVYFRAESVQLAVQMLDDTSFKADGGGTASRIKVQAADFSYKSQKDAPTKTNLKDKKRIIKKTQKMNSKLADWDDDDPSTLQETSSRWDKVVILKHMFTLKELEDDPALLLELKEDVREECSKLGEVTNVTLFDKEADGVITVRFTAAESANSCVRVMEGRFFSGLRVQAYIADGNEKFKKSSEKKSVLEEEDDEGNGDEGESKRLDQFGSWLETESASKPEPGNGD
ncbi:MAG: hypothetical protein M1825_003571 [Sarcosagium campestre]|nr:MAG: hypothetical protein M1825_003571 [Sarcosagium campestre]